MMRVINLRIVVADDHEGYVAPKTVGEEGRFERQPITAEPLAGWIYWLTCDRSESHFVYGVVPLKTDHPLFGIVYASPDMDHAISVQELPDGQGDPAEVRRLLERGV